MEVPSSVENIKSAYRVLFVIQDYIHERKCFGNAKSK
jgi:hypothetical protein